MRVLSLLALLVSAPALAQPMLVADVDEGADDGQVSELYVFDGTIYFSGKAFGGVELWRYFPSTDIAEGVTNLRAQSLKPNGMVELDGLLYFNGNNDANGRELWRFDPATDEAEVVADIAPGPDPGDPTDLVVFDGDLYFQALTVENLKELWRYDPETGVTEQTPEIRDDGSAGPIDLVPLGDFLYFRAFEDGIGDELWRYDPVMDTSTVVVNLVRGEPSSEPRHILAYDGALYFFAKSAGDSPWDQLWTYDPATDTATKLADIPVGEGEDWRPDELYLLGDDLYFFAGSADGADDLWRHRPATGVTEFVAELAPGTGDDDRRPLPLADLDGVLFFAANADASGRELWQYDSASGIVSRVTDIHPAGSSDPVDAVVFEGEIYFGATDGVNGQELWKYTPPPVAGEEGPEASGVGQIVPNPATEVARLVVSLDAPGEVRLVVIDALGREVARATQALSAGQHEMAVPLEALALGAYSIRIEAPGGIATRRMTVVR
ncbi:MAG: hypothetical protein AAGI52_10490 [Bacteroidota bacterium]